MIHHFKTVPLDRTKIVTSLRPHPDLLSNPKAYIKNHNHQIRSCKPVRRRKFGRSGWELHLDVLRYRGIKVMLTVENHNQPANITIDFNPGVCLYGQNGRILSLTEFLHALALLVTHLTPLLYDPNDWVDLVPGIRTGGPAYWSYLEIPFQCRDPDGAILAGFRHLRHLKIKTSVRHWPDSLTAGGPRSKLVLSIYRKAVEMVARGRLSVETLPQYQDILRLEARMKGDKLPHYLGNERNIEIINGEKRLVRFYPQDLLLGQRMVFGELRGVFRSNEIPAASTTNSQRDSMARLLAKVVDDSRATLSLPQLLSLVRFYTGASSKTISPIRDAAEAALSHQSAIVSADLFADSAYDLQLGIASDELELNVLHDLEETLVDPLIHKAYCPPDQPFFPVTQFPSYHRQ